MNVMTDMGEARHEKKIEGGPGEQERSSETLPPVILVIEDDPALRDLLHQTLSPGYQVLSATNGDEGVSTAFEIIPDLVICDITMPKRNGYDVCRELKDDDRTSHIPVIMVTARIEAESRIRGFESKADGYVTKPFQSRELMARVKNLIDLRKQLQQRFKAGVVLKPGEIVVPSVDDRFLTLANKTIENHMGEEKFLPEEFCREIGMSRSQVHRKLVAITGMSLLEYVRYMRLHRAKDLLERNAASVSEIAFQVGFSSPSYFSKCFRDQFGVSPTKMRGRKIEDRSIPS